MGEKILLSRKDAAEAIGVSLRSVDYLICQGHLATKAVGRRRMILRASIEKFCRSDRPVSISAEPLSRELAGNGAGPDRRPNLDSNGERV